MRQSPWLSFPPQEMTRELEPRDDSAGEPWFRQAQRHYLDQFEGRLARLRLLARQLREAPTPADLRELSLIFHHLTGSGTTYGFPEITEAARPINDLLRPLREAGAPLSALELEAVRRGIQALEESCDVARKSTSDR